jgi:hypothetical protein
MLGKDDFLFDKRLSERFIKRGALTRAEHDAYLAKLPDVTEKGEALLAADDEADPAESAAESVAGEATQPT